MVVEVLAIRAAGGEGAVPERYDVLVTVDGVEHTLHLARTGRDSEIDILDYTDKLYWTLFSQDQFYIVAVVRLLRNIENGETVTFPFRLIEWGSGARYRPEGHVGEQPSGAEAR